MGCGEGREEQEERTTPGREGGPEPQLAMPGGGEQGGTLLAWMAVGHAESREDREERLGFSCKDGGPEKDL